FLLTLSHLRVHKCQTQSLTRCVVKKRFSMNDFWPMVPIGKKPMARVRIPHSSVRIPHRTKASLSKKRVLREGSIRALNPILSRLSLRHTKSGCNRFARQCCSSVTSKLLSAPCHACHWPDQLQPSIHPPRAL